MKCRKRAQTRRLLHSALGRLDPRSLEQAEVVLTDKEYWRVQRRYGAARTPAAARKWAVARPDGTIVDADGSWRWL